MVPAVIAPCGCGMRDEEWPFDCDVNDHNGLFCSFADGDSILWVAPDDGVVRRQAQPTVKSKYKTVLGARYATESFWNDLGEESGNLIDITQPGTFTWENDTCHEYVARIDFGMGAAVFSIGSGTYAYIGCHNEVELDGSSVADASPSAGFGLDEGSIGALTLATNTYPPTLWPVYVNVDPGEVLTATLTGFGTMDSWGGGEAEFVKADFGWNLQMTAWPRGS